MLPTPTVTFTGPTAPPPTTPSLGTYGGPTPTTILSGPGPGSAYERIRLNTAVTVGGVIVQCNDTVAYTWQARIRRDADGSTVAAGDFVSVPVPLIPTLLPISASLLPDVDYRLEIQGTSGGSGTVGGLATSPAPPFLRTGVFVTPAAGDALYRSGFLLPGSQMWFDLQGVAGEPDEAFVWDATCNVEQVTIRHGRDDPTSQPEAPTATLDVWGALPARLDIGTMCEVKATLAGVDYPRFRGTVTDLTVGWDTPTAPVGRIIAVGEQARMGSRIIGGTVMSQETDGARANRCITAAGVPTDGARTDPGTVQVLTRSKDAQDALSIAQDAAADGAGVVWQAKDGAVLYADADHRRDAGVDVALDACVIPIEVEWARNLQGLVNDVTISAPVEDHYSDPASVARYGLFSTSLSTRLASRYDAENLALLILARQSDPAWVLAGIAADLQIVSAVYAADPAADQAITADLLTLEMHDLISVSGLPAGSPQPSAVLWVEGWTETIAAEQWRLELAVADYCRNAAQEIWDDVDAATTWDTAPDLTWDDITCSPPTGLGTWNDVPSRTHWDTVPAGITWNTAEDLWPS